MRNLINIVEGQMVDDTWFDDLSFQAFKIPDRREPFTVANDSGVIDTLEGPVTYNAGDYIMTGPNGEQYPISAETFNALKVDNGDGTASPKKIIKQAKLADHDGHVILKYNGSKLEYHRGKDFIVRHGPGDYGVVKFDIFNKTYSRV